MLNTIDAVLNGSSAVFVGTDAECRPDYDRERESRVAILLLRERAHRSRTLLVLGK